MRIMVPLLLPVAALFDAAIAGPPTPPRQINLLAETQVATRASCAVVWQLLLHRETWLGGFVRKQHLSGPVDRTGEVSFVHTVYQHASNDRYEEVVVARPAQRYLLAMMVPSDGISTFSDYRMRASRDGCDVAFSVKLTKLLGRGERTDQVEGLRAGTQAKIEKDLASLKQAAERRR